MDVSRQTNGADTSTSMYLSFDAESTMSSAIFKTLEASTIEMDISADATNENTGDYHINSTLEMTNRSESQINTSHVKTVKKMDSTGNVVAAKNPTPLCPYPKNILQEYKAVCSTPSKEQLLRSVQIKRGSNVEDCMDFGFAFSDIEEEKQLSICGTLVPVEENKENAQPDSEDGSTLSASSVEIVTSVIERKLLVQSTANEDNFVQKEEVNQEGVDIIELVVENAEITAEAKDTVESKVVSGNEQNLLKPGNPINKLEAKPRRNVVISKNVRKSVCEPDLKTNRPSRIVLNSKKRNSLAIPTARSEDKLSEIPQLLNAMLKIADTKQEEKVGVVIKCEEAASDRVDKRKSMVAIGVKAGSSKHLTVRQRETEKRPFCFSQRMSILLKTTLNSPARKIARRSFLPNATQTRKSSVPHKFGEVVGAGANGNVVPKVARKSMLPVIKEKTAKPTTSIDLKKNTNGVKIEPKLPITRKSLCPAYKPAAAAKATVETKMKSTTASAASGLTSTTSKPKAVITSSKIDPNAFTCYVCGNKFSLKSLLNAHMRSHEDGVPAFVKKPLAATTTTNSNSRIGGPTNAIANDNGTNTSAATKAFSIGGNQCKYCDKKFALVRALRIHLLERCTKIPPTEKRKLEFTELNHVEKPQLPAFFHGNATTSHSGSSSHSSSLVAPATARVCSSQPPTTVSDASSAVLSSTESLTGKKDITDLANDLVAAMDNVLTKMAPPNKSKVKKKHSGTAHSGVYRTPNKSVPCHICKMSFKNILDYTEHNMTLHSSFTPSMNCSDNSSNDLSST